MDSSELIAAQDLEFEESLRIDREKDELKVKEKENRERIQENILTKKESLLTSRGGDLISIKFQLPSKSVTYIFGSRDRILDLYNFIYTQDMGENFDLYIGYPKKLLINNNSSIESNNIKDRTKINVYFNQN